MNDKILAWHFVAKTLRDGSPIPEDNVPLIFDGDLVICRSGLHAAEKILDALSYAPGHTICRVECEAIGERHSDKFVCAQRTILWRINGEQLLGSFARKVALDVIGLWDAPKVVRQYLETGDETIKTAAGAAARAAARAAAGAACDAAGAAWDAARDAAWDAAWDARSAAMAAARAAGAACDAAGAAAWDAALAKYNEWLTKIVEETHTELNA